MLPVELAVKSQYVRLADVFAIGPLMVYGAYKMSAAPMAARILLGFFGVSTVLYNAANYIKVEETKK